MSYIEHLQQAARLLRTGERLHTELSSDEHKAYRAEMAKWLAADEAGYPGIPDNCAGDRR